MKKIIPLALSAVMAFSLVACGSAPADKASSTDAVSTPSVYTKQYTNLDQPTLLEEIDKYTGVSVIATTNADGTPNNAILTPAACRIDHTHQLLVGIAEVLRLDDLLQSGAGPQNDGVGIHQALGCGDITGTDGQLGISH